MSECIDFVRQFNDTTFDSEKAASLSTYMEKTIGDNTTLQYVTLNLSLIHISKKIAVFSPFKSVLAEQCIEAIPFNGKKSVSYTHLDVYKRQI